MSVNEKNNPEHHHQPLRPIRLTKVREILISLTTRKDPRRHPFTDGIIDTLLSPKWKGLTIKLYDGSTNLDEHLNVFKMQMTLYPTNKAVWCKVFPTSLQKEPLSWFTELPPNFVGNFKVLTTKFVTQYATSRPHLTSFMSLLNVKKQKKKNPCEHLWTDSTKFAWVS